MNDFVEPLLGGLALLGRFDVWVAIAVGTVVGVIVGALPGLGTTLAYALILPFTFPLDIEVAVALLLAVTVGSQYGNSIPAILVGVPGSPAAVLTVLDGYALHRRGETGLALALAFIAAVGGQLVSTLFFIAAIVPLGGIAYYFLQPELFSLYLVGIVAIISLTGKNMLKGLIAASVGLLLALIGLDPVNFTPRFDFGVPQLRTGLNTSAVVIGFLAVSELLRQTRQAFQWDSGPAGVAARFPPFRKIRPTLPAMLGGTVVGTLIGAIPGAGSTPAAMISYQQAQILSKHPEEFGNGSPEGIAANEAAQNASSSGELIPTLGLGLPASGSMVLLLAALTLNGFVPGPNLVREAPELLHAVIAGLIGASLLLVFTGWPMARGMTKLLGINRSVVVVLSLATVVLGVFSLRYRLFDVVVCFACGALGYFMLRYGYSVAAAALAVVLAAGFEASLRRGLSIFDDDLGKFLSRPITAVILVIAFAFFVLGVRRTVQSARAARVEGAATSATDPGPTALVTHPPHPREEDLA